MARKSPPKKRTHGRHEAKHWSLDLIRNDADAPSLCVQVREGIRRQILDGKLSAGDALIPQRQLCKILDVNQVTLTQAISDLLKEGLLRSEHGRGIFINKLTPPTVGIVYYNSRRALDANLFYGPIARAAADRLSAANMRVKYITREKYVPELRFGPVLSDVLDADVDAYVTIGIQNDEYLATLLHSNRPLVAVDATPMQADLNAVVADSFREGYLVTRHLLENGHRRIIFIAHDRGVHPADPERRIRIPEPDSVKRLAGYLLALGEAGISSGLAHVFQRMPEPGSPEEAALARMIGSGEATAAVVPNSHYAEWFEARVKVPDEFSVMSFSMEADKRWSSCHVNPATMGRAAAERVLALLARQPDGRFRGGSPSEGADMLITVTPTLLPGRSVKRIGGPPAYYRYLQGQLDPDFATRAAAKR